MRMRWDLPYKTCLDRPFVQLEARKALEAGKPIITVFEEERRKQAYFDYACARKKYEATEWKLLLDIDAVTYRRDEREAQAMVDHILDKVQVSAKQAPAGNL